MIEESPKTWIIAIILMFLFVWFVPSSDRNEKFVEQADYYDWRDEMR